MLSRLLLASALGAGACRLRAGPNYVAQPVSAAAAGAVRLGRRRPRRLAGASRRAIGGGSTTTRCSTGWSPMRLPPNTDIRVAVAQLAKARASLREDAVGPRCRRSNVGADQRQYGRSPGVQRLPASPADATSRSMPASTFPMKSICSAASAAASRRRAAMSARRMADADAVRVAVVCRRLPRAYADAASSAERIAVAQHIVDLLDESLALTASGGARSGSQTASTPPASPPCGTSAQPRFRRSRPSAQAALFRLATLTGRAPRDLPAELRPSATRRSTPRPADPGRRRRRAARAAPRRPRRRTAAGRRDRADRRRDGRSLSAHHARRIGRVKRRRHSATCSAAAAYAGWSGR